MPKKRKTSNNNTIPFTPLLQDIESIKKKIVELQAQIKHINEKINTIMKKIEIIENEVKTQHIDIANIAMNLSQQKKRSWLRWWKK